MRQPSAAVNYMFPWAIHRHDFPRCDRIKAMQGDGAAVPGLSLLLHCQLDFSEVFKEQWMRQEQKQPPSKVVWGEQCPGTSFTPYPPWRYGVVVGATIPVLPNTFSLQQWRWEADFWHYWRSRNSPLVTQPQAARPQPGLLLASSHSLFPDAWYSRHWN